MRTSVRRMLAATAIAGGFTALGIACATTASAADEPGTTSGANGLLSGNQTHGSAHAPVHVTGNQVTVIGNHNRSQSQQPADRGGSTGGSSGTAPSSGGTTSGEHGAGSGNQTKAGVHAPVHVSGNQVTALGNDNETRRPVVDRPGTGGQEASGDSTSGEGGAGSGNQTDADVHAPVHVTGNQVTVLGDHQVSDVQPGDNGVGESAYPDGASGSAAAGDKTSGEDGLGSGNQTGLGVLAPIGATGNQITVIGDGNSIESTSSESGSSGGSAGAGSAGTGDKTSGEDGLGSGNQTGLGVLAPIGATGNQITVIGDGNTSETAEDESATNGSGGSTTDGTGGTGSGNQTTPLIEVPIDLSDNQVTIIGDGNDRTPEAIVPADPSEPSDPSDPSGPDGPSAEPGTENGTDNGTGGVAAPGSTSTDILASALPQAGPAVTDAGVLPQTGAASGLVLWGALGLLMLLAGLALMAGQRRRAILVGHGLEVLDLRRH